MNLHPHLPPRLFFIATVAACLFAPSAQIAPSQTALVGTSGDAQSSSTQQTSNEAATTTSQTMPAEQLIQILRGSPEIMVEVKSVITDAAQQQGVSVQPDALTDQEVYARITTSAQLRASVTQFLRARGYVSEAEIEEANRSDQSAVFASSETATLEDPRPPAGTSTASLATDRTDAADIRRVPEGNQDRVPFRTSVPDSMKRSSAQTPNITDAPSALHRPAPYNLRSLRDLYTQAPEPPQHLTRFGTELFTIHEASGFVQHGVQTRTSLDVPLGPDYVLGPGDELSISLWGGVSQNYLRIVDRDGRLTLPEAGSIQVAGLTMQAAQVLIAGAMRAQFHNAQVAVTIAQVRSIRIYIVGDVQRPGAYDVSALASPISALFAAGGPTAVGSLRILRHFRNQKLVGEIDLYDFMLHGIRPGDDRLESGDTLLVPPVGTQVAVGGAVKRPAIYELRNEKSVDDVLDDAGGLTVAASLTHITISRIVANQHREEISATEGATADTATLKAQLSAVSVQDGDRVNVATVLPYSQRVIYLQGHVARPGKIAYRNDMQLSDVLRSYQDLLPEPADRGEIIRLVAPDEHPETIAFDLPEVLIGNSNVRLAPFDTIRIFGRYEHDAPTVSVRGEVLHPGDYPMFKGMSAADLVRTAGGFKRDALTKQADLASYQIEEGVRAVVQRQDVSIGDAVLKHDTSADVSLKPGDVLTIHQITGWNDIGASIVVEGEVAHPGSYGFQEGEHLSDVLRRAGGFRSTAYPEGAVFTRPDVATLEEKSRDQLIHQIEESAASARISPGDSGAEKAETVRVIREQQEQVISQLRNQPVTGRLVIHIESDISRWAGTAADIELRSGDTLRIPKRPGFVLITGQVYNPSAITFNPGHSAGWYLQRAGGATSTANRKEIFIIRANGTVIGRNSNRWFGHDVLSTHLNPGDTIVVPQKIIGPSVTWRNLLATAQIATSLAIAAAVAGL